MDALAGRARRPAWSPRARRARRSRAGPPEADGDPEAVAAGARLAGALEWRPTAALAQPEVIVLAVVCAAASIFFGVYPSPLLDLAHDAGAAFTNLF